jgi:uncharacterized membrane protein YkoI
MTDNRSLPESTPDTTPATHTAADSTANTDTIGPRPDHAEAAPRRSRTRNLLIAGGAVLAAAALAGGGIVVGAAIADEMDDDDDDRTSASTASDDVGADDDTPAGSQSADRGTGSADELSEIIAAAARSAEGDAVGIEAEGDGSWGVQFETPAGDETDVRVTADAATEVISTGTADADYSPAQGVLDVQTVDALVAAALAEVDGKIIDIEIDDDTASPFDVSVLRADGTTVELVLDADMKVLSSDRT